MLQESCFESRLELSDGSLTSELRNLEFVVIDESPSGENPISILASDVRHREAQKEKDPMKPKRGGGRPPGSKNNPKTNAETTKLSFAGHGRRGRGRGGRQKRGGRGRRRGRAGSERFEVTGVLYFV